MDKILIHLFLLPVYVMAAGALLAAGILLVRMVADNPWSLLAIWGSAAVTAVYFYGISRG